MPLGGSPPNLAHHRGIPWWVPDYLHCCIFDPLDAEQGPLDALGNAFAHGTAGGGERHLDRHLGPGDGRAINEAEIDDVAADFGINHLTQCVQDNLFVK